MAIYTDGFITADVTACDRGFIGEHRKEFTMDDLIKKLRRIGAEFIGVKYYPDGEILLAVDEERSYSIEADEDFEEAAKFIVGEEYKYRKKPNEDSNEKDDYVSPNHYETKSMRCRDIIKVMVEGLTPMEAVDMANIIKYLYRFKHKDGMKDLKKVAEYAKFLMEDTEIKVE